MTSYLSAGDSGNLGAEWKVQNGRRNALSRIYGVTDPATTPSGNMDFSSALLIMGVDDDVVLNKIEFDILGVDKRYDGELLNWTSSAWSNKSVDDRLFIGSDQKMFTNVDLENGTYKTMDEQTMSESLGMDWSGGKPYDILELQNNRVNFYDFVFSGTGDGNQENVKFNLNDLTSARWGVNSYTIREVNVNLAKAEETNNYESFLAHDTLNKIKAAIPQWMTNDIKLQLAKYEEGTAEYNQKFIELAFKLMDNEGYLQGKEITSPAEEYFANL